VLGEHFANTEKLKAAVVFPGKDAKPEEVAAFLQKMGIPAGAEGYGLDAKLIPAETGEQRGQAAKEIAAVIHRNGLTKKQGQAIFAEYAKMLAGIGQNAEARRKELAATFDERLLKDARDEKAATETREYFKRALVALGDKALVEKLSMTGMLYDTTLVKAFSDIWKAGNREPPMPESGSGRDSCFDSGAGLREKEFTAKPNKSNK
jgi:hypothetical protein